MLDPNQQNSLWYGTRGRPDAPIVLVGESWGHEEAAQHKPFVGSSGHELNRMLQNAHVSPTEILYTNVVAAQPQGNETWRFFTPAESHSGAKIGGLAPSDLVQREVRRLYAQISSGPRKLVIAAGNYALWALSRVSGAKKIAQSNNRRIPKELQTWAPNGIMDWRGSMWYCEPHPEFLSQSAGPELSRIPLLPIVHPAAIMRAWYMREPTVHDLKKRVPLALKSDWRPEYDFLAPPTFDQTTATLRRWLDQADRGQLTRLACDIETFIRGRLITCVGFADSPTFAISIPFIRKVDPGRFDSWWTPEQEADILRLIRRVLTHDNIWICGQNFVYDTQYFQRYMGFTPRLDHDTMLHQNVCFPGTPKALEYLSSLYCKYHWYWKEDHKEWDLKGTVEQLLRYNAMDCVRTWEIAENQETLTHQLGMEAQFAFKMRTNALCLRMMNRGVLFDRRKRSPLLFELQEALGQLNRELLEIIPQEWIGPVGKRAKDKGGGDIFWTTSDHQQKTLFYDFLGFRPVRDPKTQSLTTGKKALKQFLIWYPELTGLMNRLMLANSISNTVGVLKSEVDFDGRMRCSYNPGGTETHRLSSSENAFGGGMNLQNLTKGDEDD